MRKAIVAICLMTVLACGTTLLQSQDGKGRPQWVDDPGSVYPDNLYLSATGEGMSRRDAENSALGNLAKRFSTSVKVEQTVTQRIQELTKNDQTDSQSLFDSQQKVQTSSGETLYNVQYGETYTDSKGQVYIVAFIDRMKTADLYDDMIGKNSGKVVFYRDRATGETDLMAKLASLRAAQAFSLQNEMLLEQLSVISADMRDMVRLPYEANTITAAVRDVGRQVGFSISITNDPDEKVARLVKDFLTSQGFSLSAATGWSVHGEVRIEDTDIQTDDEMKCVRWYLNLDVRNPAEETIVSYSDKGRTCKMTVNEARALVIRKIEEKINADFRQKLNQYLDGLIVKK